jgi:hypothetical protein
MKKKIPFDISYREKIESGEASVVTRDGRPVKILLWDAASVWPIVARIDDRTFVKQYKENGLRAEEDEDDLFILVDDPLSEFEERLGQIIIPTWDITKECQDCQGDVDSIRQWSAELLDLARKALRPEFDEELEQAYKNQDDVVYRRGYEEGFQAGSAIDEERLTDKIAEKIAEKVVKGGNPFANKEE